MQNNWTKCAWCGKTFLPVNVGPTAQKYCKKTHSKKAQAVRQKANRAGGVCIKPHKKKFSTEAEAEGYLIKHHHRLMYSYQCPSTVDIHYHIATGKELGKNGKQARDRIYRSSSSTEQ